MAEPAPRLNVTLIGPSGSGKSTLAGHLLLKLGQVDQRKVDQLAKGASAMNRESAKYAWVSSRACMARMGVHTRIRHQCQACMGGVHCALYMHYLSQWVEEVALHACLGFFDQAKVRRGDSQ